MTLDGSDLFSKNKTNLSFFPREQGEGNAETALFACFTSGSPTVFVDLAFETGSAVICEVC